MKKWAVLLAIFCSPAHALDAGPAQGKMFERMNRELHIFMDTIGATSEVNTFCQIQMNLFTDAQPKNGNIPFGVNYNALKTEAELNTIITVREAFETIYMKRCMVEVMRDLSYRPAK